MQKACYKQRFSDTNALPLNSPSYIAVQIVQCFAAFRYTFDRPRLRCILPEDGHPDTRLLLLADTVQDEGAVLERNAADTIRIHLIYLCLQLCDAQLARTLS